MDYKEPFNLNLIGNISLDSKLNKNCNRCGGSYLGTEDGLCFKCKADIAKKAEEDKKAAEHKRKLFERMHK